MTVDVWAVCDGLAAAGIIQVAMASPGEDGKPVVHLLAGNVAGCLVNAAQVKQGPGRQPATAAARWLATRMRDGLWQARCLPPPGQRDRRELTRDRAQVVQERSRAIARGHEVLARAHSTLASVATDILGVSGRASLAAVLAGRAEPATMAAWAKGRLHSKIPAGAGPDRARAGPPPAVAGDAVGP